MDSTQERRSIQFSEATRLWQEIPEWVQFLVKFGFYWQRQEHTNRRIALISMPCDSAAAGLVALGALRRSLEDPNADDVNLHLERIRNEPKRILSHRNHPGCNYRYDGYRKSHNCDMIVPVKRNYMPISFQPRDVCFKGEPFLEVNDGNKLPYGPIYQELVSSGGRILDANLSKTYSGTCFAGRNMGEKATQDNLSTIRFRCGNIAASLEQLLSVHNWLSGERISRLSFFNSRIKKLDRYITPPNLVIADGDGAFFTVLEDDSFTQSDIISSINRTLERDRLEKISEKMSSLSQWYLQLDTVAKDFPSIPAGISIAIWSKR